MILEAKARLPERVETLVIGGGTIGLPLSLRLADTTGAHVLCLESGGWDQPDETHPLNAVEQRGIEYAGAEHGRFRVVGGTSTRWGGALIPFQDADMADWPIGWGDLAPYLADVESLFGLDGGPYTLDDAGITSEHMVARLAKWPPFAKRNVWKLLQKRLRSSTNCTLATDSIVTGLVPETDAIVVTVIHGGRACAVRTNRLVIAAGAIETTRLTLLLDRAMEGQVRKVSPLLGQTFSDHLSIEIGQVVPRDRAALNRQFGCRFARSGMMRNLRFELAPDTPRRAQVRPGFVHIGYATDGTGGFDYLRTAMQQVQRGSFPARATIAGLLRNAPWLARAVKWRFADKRQLFPAGADLVAHAVIEQAPDTQNAITLSDTLVDSHGTPLPAITWQVSAEDVAQLQSLARIFERHWKSTGLSQLGAFEPFPAAETAGALVHSGGIYHPTGSTRMGCSPAEGVVDGDLRLFAEPRIQLASTSVLPTGGGANPTMTALMLAMRLAASHGSGA